MSAVRTPLTYYGGKQGMAPQIVPLIPAHRVYLEPFAGGAAILFAKTRAERETLNDADGTIMRFWRALRDRPNELAAAVAGTPYSRQEWRDSAGPCDDDVEAARRLLVRVDQSFSRSRQSWSVPCIGDGRGRWQPGSWENLPPKILAAAQRLRGVALENGDALDLIPKWDRPDAVIYCDPPYTGPLRTEPSKGYAVDDDGTLWDRLVDVLADVRHARVLLSGYPCDEAERLGWEHVDLRMRRTVQARSGDALTLAPERLWLSPNVRAHDLFSTPAALPREAEALAYENGYDTALMHADERVSAAKSNEQWQRGCRVAAEQRAEKAEARAEKAEARVRGLEAQHAAACPECNCGGVRVHDVNCQLALDHD